MDSRLWPGGRRCHRWRQRTEARASGGAARQKMDSVSGPFLDGAASLLPPSGVGFVLTCVCVCVCVCVYARACMQAAAAGRRGAGAAPGVGSACALKAFGRPGNHSVVLGLQWPGTQGGGLVDG